MKWYGSPNMSQNIAYIDGANLHKGTEDLGWKLDYRKFRVWLTEKYSVGVAKIFIGKVPEFKSIYKNLRNAGFVISFKTIRRGKGGAIKGNCDSELIVTTMTDYYEHQREKVVIVSSDGDFSSLANFLKKRGVIVYIVSPRNSCSLLLKRLNISILYLDTQRNILELSLQNEKALDGDETP